MPIGFDDRTGVAFCAHCPIPEGHEGHCPSGTRPCRTQLSSGGVSSPSSRGPLARRDAGAPRMGLLLAFLLFRFFNGRMHLINQRLDPLPELARDFGSFIR